MSLGYEIIGLKDVKINNNNYTVIIKDFKEISDSACDFIECLINRVDLMTDYSILDKTMYVSFADYIKATSINLDEDIITNINKDMEFVKDIVFFSKVDKQSFSFKTFIVEDNIIKLDIVRNDYEPKSI